MEYNRLELKDSYMQRAIAEGFAPALALTAFDPIIDVLEIEGASWLIYVGNARFAEAYKHITGEEVTARGIGFILDQAKVRQGKSIAYLVSSEELESGETYEALTKVLSEEIRNLLIIVVETGIAHSGVYTKAFMPVFQLKTDATAIMAPYRMYYSVLGEGYGKLEGKAESIIYKPNKPFYKKWIKEMQIAEKRRLEMRDKAKLLSKQNENKK